METGLGHRRAFRHASGKLRTLGPATAAVALLALATPALGSHDTATPVLNSFSRQTSATVVPGNPVRMTYSVSDTGSGVRSVVFHFTDPLGGDRQVRMDGTYAAYGPASATVDASWPTGSYRLDYVDVADAEGNRVTYVAGGSTYRSPPTASGPSSHTFNFDAAGFTVSNGPARPKPVVRGILDRAGLPAPAWQRVVNAYVVRVNWADLQPARGGALTTGNAIDAAVAQVRQLNSQKRDTEPRLSLKLRVLAGNGAPEWAKSLDGPAVTVEDATGTGTATIGRFWTENFRVAYDDLQAKLAARYDGVPEIRDVVVSRCMLTTAEPFLRGVSGDMTVSNLRSAGFTWEADHVCHTQQVDAHRVWATTASSLAFNPYVQINSDGTIDRRAGEAWTEEMMRYCRQVLGARCVLANNSIRDPISEMGNYYAQMYPYMRSLGPPISFQTAAPARIGSLCNTLGWAVGQGAGAVEVPQNYDSDSAVTVAGLTSYDAGLERGAAADTVAPTAPTGLSGSWQTGRVALSWGPASDSGFGVACYSVSRNGVALGTTMATTFIDPSPGSTNSYAVTASDGSANQGPAATTTVSNDTNPPSTPTGLTATASSPTRVDLSWDPSTDDVDVAGYRVYRNGALLATVTGTTFSDTGVAPETSYTYAVQAFDAAGNASAATNGVTVRTPPAATTTTTSVPPTTTTTRFTFPTTTTTTRLTFPTTTTTQPADSQPPTAPTSLRVTSKAGGIGLAWNASTDNAGVAGYRVYRNSVQIAAPAETTFTDTTAVVGTWYIYHVRAVDRAGNLSQASNSVTATRSS